ncbi:MAG: GNAT family N-acetyltransferase [Proteobacteria bacterium]|nr:GNAT family N-acetyltransferase [Pseudomonadota bacterium]
MTTTPFWMADLTDITIREAVDGDAQGLIALIGEIFSDYDNCVLDLERLDRELLAIDTCIKGLGGKFWVAEYQGEIVASIGYAPKGGGVVELKRLYVARAWRRRGLADRLTGLIYQAAKDLRATAIELWSDTRFVEAHAFYLKHGFEELPETRDLNDPSNSTEYHFIKKL